MKLFKRLICRFKGCDFGPVVYCSPSVLIYCRRCGDELMRRTIDDLEPMTDEDSDFLDSLNDIEEAC